MQKMEMTMPVYAAGVLISFLGIISGVILSWLSAEELTVGRSNIRFFFYLLAAMAITVVAYFGRDMISILAAGAMGVFLVVSFWYERLVPFLYGGFGVLMYLSSDDAEGFAVFCSIVFVCGLCLTSLEAGRYVKDKAIGGRQALALSKAVLVRYVWMVPVAVLLYAVF